MTGDILFLTHRAPFPPNRGDKIRSWNILKALAKIAPVHVVALADDLADLRHSEMLGSVATSVKLVSHRPRKIEAMARALLSGGSASVAACHSKPMSNAVEAVLRSRNIGTIYAFSGQMAHYVPQPCAQRFLMDFVDMDSAKFAAWGEKRSLGGLANRFEARRLFAFERAVAARADTALFVSEAEARLFRRATGMNADRIVALENGIDLTRYHPGHRASPLAGQGPHIVFTGQMDYAPNVEAVVSFARATFPAIRAAHSRAHFWIVGRAPLPAVKALADLPGVEVTGEVTDPRDWIAGADLVVAPLLLARGIQNKVLEAMAMGKAVLATPAAAEGIDALGGRDLAIAEGSAPMASTARELLADPARAEALGQAARARMVARYDWAATLAPLDALVRGLDRERAAA